MQRCMILFTLFPLAFPGTNFMFPLKNVIYHHSCLVAFGKKKKKRKKCQCQSVLLMQYFLNLLSVSNVLLLVSNMQMSMTMSKFSQLMMLLNSCISLQLDK